MILSFKKAPQAQFFSPPAKKIGGINFSPGELTFSEINTNSEGELTLGGKRRGVINLITPLKGG